jgi:hypothetical protein
MFFYGEREDYGLKYYQPNEFGPLAEAAGLTVSNAFIDYNRTAYSGQKTDRIVYELRRMP